MVADAVACSFGAPMTDKGSQSRPSVNRNKGSGRQQSQSSQPEDQSPNMIPQCQVSNQSKSAISPQIPDIETESQAALGKHAASIGAAIDYRDTWLEPRLGAP